MSLELFISLFNQILCISNEWALGWRPIFSLNKTQLLVIGKVPQRLTPNCKLIGNVIDL